MSLSPISAEVPILFEDMREADYRNLGSNDEFFSREQFTYDIRSVRGTETLPINVGVFAGKDYSYSEGTVIRDPNDEFHDDARNYEVVKDGFNRFSLDLVKRGQARLEGRHGFLYPSMSWDGAPITSTYLAADESVEFFKAERDARINRRGIWAGDNIISPDQMDRALQGRGLPGYQIGPEDLSSIELRMLGRGLGDLYRRRHRTISYGDKMREQGMMAGGITIDYDARTYLPNQPTVLPEVFYQNFRNQEIPNAGLYERLYRSRTASSEVPDIVREADRQLEAPGLGERFNRLVGLGLYQEGSGVVGSMFRGLGKIFDYAFGYEAYDVVTRARNGDFEGSISKYHREQYGVEETFSGPFEQLFSSAVELATGTAIATAAYTGINLPIQHLFADTFQKSIDELVLAREIDKTPGMGSSFFRNLRNTFRSVFFGVRDGAIINRALESEQTPYSVRKSIQQGIKDNEARFMYFEFEPHPTKMSTLAKIRYQTFGSAGMLAGIKAQRRYDKAAFDILMKPIFEAMSPYDLRNAHVDDASPAKAYYAALKDLSETLGKPPEIEFDNPSSTNGNAKKSGMRITNIGRDRVVSIAKAYDTLGALIPANISYWHPAIRKALKLPEFDPKTNLTIKDVVSFEELTLWSEQYVKVAKDFALNPFGSIKNTLRLWTGEMTLRTAEGAMAMRIRNSSRAATASVATELDAILADPELTVAERAKSLERLHQAKIKNFEQQTEDLFKSRIYKNYTKMLSDQDKLLRRSSSVANVRRQIEADISKGTDPSFKKQSDAVRRQLVRSKKLMAVVGVTLVANKLMDDFFIKAQGIDYGTQLKLRKALETENGTVASFYYNPTPNGFVVGTGSLLVAGAAGLMIPTEMGYDSTNYSSRPGTPIGQLKNAHYNLGNQFAQQISKAAQGLDFNAEQITADVRTKTSQYMDATTRMGGSTIHSRRRLKFNKTAAVAGGLLAMVGIKGLYSVHAGISNFVEGNYKNPTPDAVGSVVAAIAESMIPASQSEVGTYSARDQAKIAVLSHYAQSMLKVGKHADRTFNIAHQITSPYGQVANVIKIDSEGATLGVGYQLMPVTGLGFSPTLPFGFNNKDIVSVTPVNSPTFNIVKALTLSELSYKKDSNYEMMANYLGASTALGLVFGQLRRSFSSDKLLKKNSSYWLSREAMHVKSVVQPLAPFVKAAIEVPHKAVTGLMALPFVAGEAFVTGVKAFLTPESGPQKASVHPTKSPGLPRQYSHLGPLVRRAAPYYMALVASRMLSEYYFDGTTTMNDEKMRVSGTLISGLFVGGLMDYTGVFASADQIAVSVYGKKLTEHNAPMVRNRYKDVKPRTIIGSKSLQREIVGEFTDVEAAILKTDKYVGTYRSVSKFKSVGARVKTAMAVMVGARVTAALAVNGLSKVISDLSGVSERQSVDKVYSTAFVGPVLRVLSGIEPYDKSEFKANRGNHSVGSSGIMNAISAAASMVFGQSLTRMIGLYSDTPDPFFGIPFGGFSFKDSGVAYYMQFASSGSDLSMSAYDMVRRSSSLSDVISWRSVLEDGPPQNFRQFYERARGGNLRKKAASYKGYTNSELSSLSSSGGLARALQVKNANLRQLSWQSPQELILDFLVKGYESGVLDSNVIRGNRLNKVYDPYSVLVGGLIGIEESTRSGLSVGDTGIQDWAMRAVQSANSRSTRVRKYNPFTDSADLSQRKSPGIVSSTLTYMPFLVGAIGALGSLAFSIGTLSLHYNRNEFMKIYESSKLVRGVSIFSPTAYGYESILDETSGRYKLYQTFSNTTKAELQTDMNALISRQYGTNQVNQITAMNLSEDINKRHRSLIRSVDSYFSPSSGTSNLNADLNILFEGELTDTKIQDFKNRFKNTLRDKVRRGYGAKIGPPGNSRNLYSVVYGIDLNRSDVTALDDFISSGSKIESALDDMANAAIERAVAADVAGSSETVLKVAKIKQAIEDAEGTRQFISLIEQPNPTTLQPEDLIEKSINVQVEAREAANRKVQKVYSEGVLKGSYRAGMSVGRGLILWSFLGKDIYSGVESIGLLADDETDRFTRKAAADQLVNTAFLGAEAWLISGLITAGAGVALPGLAVAGLTVAGMLGLGLVKQQFGGFLMQKERGFKGAIARGIMDPVEGLAGILDNVGLGDPFRAVGRPAGFVTQQVMKAITAPIRALTGGVIAPWLVEKTMSMQKSSLGKQMFWNSILPSTAYMSALSFSPGRQTVFGTEPFVYGNPIQYFAYQQAASVKRASSVDIYLESDFIHPEVSGRSAGFKQKNTYSRMMRSYSGGGRILSNFNLDSGYLSARLRKELELKQGLMHLNVTSAPLKQLSKAYTHSTGLSLNGIVRGLLNWKLPSITGGVFDSLKDSFLKLINLPSSVSLGIGTIGKWSGFDLPVHMLKLGSENFKKGLGNLSLFKDLRSLTEGLNSKVLNPSIGLGGRIIDGIQTGVIKAAVGTATAFRNLSGAMTGKVDEAFGQRAEAFATKMLDPRYRKALLGRMGGKLLGMFTDTFYYAGGVVGETWQQYAPGLKSSLRATDSMVTRAVTFVPKTVAGGSKSIGRMFEAKSAARILRKQELLLSKQNRIKELIQLKKSQGTLTGALGKEYAGLQKALRQHRLNVNAHKFVTSRDELLTPMKEPPLKGITIKTVDGVIEPKTAAGEALIERQLKEGYGPDRQPGMFESGYRKSAQFYDDKNLRRFVRPFANPVNYLKGLFIAADVGMSMFADSVVEDHLADYQHAGHYRQAYVDQYSAVGAAHTTTFISNLRVNPLFAIGAVIGGSLIGSRFGHTAGMDAYDKRFEEENRTDRLFKQTMINTSLGVLAQSPTTLKMIAQGRYRAAVARLTTTVLVGAGSGGLGYGAATQATAITYGSHLLDSKMGTALGLESRRSSSLFLGKKIANAKYAVGKNYLRKTNAWSRAAKAKGALDSRYGRLLMSRGIAGKTARFVRGSMGKLGRAAGILGKGLTTLMTVAQVGSAVFDIVGGAKQGLEARNHNQYIESQKSYSRGFGTLGGMVLGFGLGSMVGGPGAGLLASGLVGMGTGAMFENLGRKNAKRAIEQDVSPEQLMKNQSIGTTIGLGLGLIAGAGVLVAGAALAAPAAVVGGAYLAIAGLGGLLGFVGGSEYTLRNKGKVNARGRVVKPRNYASVEKSDPDIHPKPARRKRPPGRHPKPNADITAKISKLMTGGRSQKTAIVATATVSDTPYLTEEDYDKELERKKAAYSHLSNSGYTSIRESEKEPFDPFADEADALDQPWWSNVMGFMNGIWDRSGSAFMSMAKKIKSSFGAAITQGRNLFNEVSQRAGNLKDWAGGIANKGVATVKGAMSKLGALRKKVADAARAKAAAAFGGSAAMGGSAYFDPVFRDGKVIRLSEEDFFNLLVMSYLETGSTGQDAVDVGAAILNRQASNDPAAWFAKSTNTITDITMARSPIDGKAQFEPLDRWGVTTSRNAEEAVTNMMKKNRSTDRDSYMRKLNELQQSFANPQMTESAEAHVGGRLFFKGESELPFKQADDPWRGNKSSNFFHDESYSSVSRTRADMLPVILDVEGFERNKAIAQARASSSATLPNGMKQMNFNGYFISGLHDDRSGEPGVDFVLHNPSDVVLGIPLAFPVDAKVTWIGVQGNPSARRGYGKMIELEYAYKGRSMKTWIAHLQDWAPGIKEGMVLPAGTVFGTQGRSGSTNAGWYGDGAPGSDLGTHVSIDFPGSSYALRRDFVDNALIPYLTGRKPVDISKSQPKITAAKAAESNQTIRSKSKSSGSISSKHGHAKYSIADKSSLRSVGNGVMLHVDAAEAWKKMAAAAARDGVELMPGSGYRSVEEQNVLWKNQVAKQGGDVEAAAKISAPGGYSQHQTGFAIDLWDPAYGLQRSFERSPQFKWMQKYGPQYGFELPYKKENDNLPGAGYEPWHWMYAGSPKAKEEYQKFVNSMQKYRNNAEQDKSNLHSSVSPASRTDGIMVGSVGVNNSSTQYPEHSLVSMGIAKAPTEKAKVESQTAEEEKSQLLASTFKPSMLETDITPEQFEEQQRIKEKIDNEMAVQVALATDYVNENLAKQDAIKPTIQIQTNNSDVAMHDTAIKNKKPSDRVATVRSAIKDGKEKIEVIYSEYASAPEYVAGYEESSEYSLMDTALNA